MLYPVRTETRETSSLSGIWQVAYDFDEIGLRENWAAHPPQDRLEEAGVPGSLNEQSADRQRYLHMGSVWYYRRFYLPRGWRGQRVVVRFGSANYRAEVFVNSARLGSHETGYTPFEFELPAECFEGENLLCVRVDNRLDATTIPQGELDFKLGGLAALRPGNFPNVHYDFFPFSGLQRAVTLYTTGPAFLRDTRWTTLQVGDHTATGTATFRVGGKADTLRVRIAEIGWETEVALEDGLGMLDFELTGVTPWAPGSPKLYDIEMRVLQGSDVLDHYVLPFGFRTVAVDRNRFLVNGEPVYLRGFGKHEDFHVLGRGLSEALICKDNNLLQWTGANSYRTSHYPYAEEWLQSADRQGILVIDETAANTLSLLAVNDDPAKRAKLLANHKAHIAELIARDANHACVIAWSLGNECEMQKKHSQGYFTEITDYARTLDASRPITCVACYLPDGDEDLEMEAFDFLAYNLYVGWYGACGQYEKIGPRVKEVLDDFTGRYDKPMLYSEFGADTFPGEHSLYELQWSEEFEQRYMGEFITAADGHPRCLGTHVWNFADFRVGQHFTRPLLNWKGVFTREREPKAAAHTLRRLWQEPPASSQ